jgi:hypothetical protein
MHFLYTTSISKLPPDARDPHTIRRIPLRKKLKVHHIVPMRPDITTPLVPATVALAISVAAYRHARRETRWGSSLYSALMTTVGGGLAFAWWDMYAPTHPATHAIAHRLGLQHTRMVRYAGDATNTPDAPTSHLGDYCLGCGEIRPCPGDPPPARPLVRAISYYDAERLFNERLWWSLPGYFNRDDSRALRRWGQSHSIYLQAMMRAEGFLILPPEGHLARTPDPTPAPSDHTAIQN